MVGPVAKIDPRTLPSRPNIHYLGAKSYKELPGYIAGWEVAMLPFARNEATRFISPTKTPEYLAAGRPVVSTSIPDVVRPYGEEGLAESLTRRIASWQRSEQHSANRHPAGSRERTRFSRATHGMPHGPGLLSACARRRQH